MTARQMFVTRGYDRTTVGLLIDTLGVSKGAFYHHFVSKEELLDAVVEGMVKRAFDQVGPVLRQPSLKASEKLNLYLAASRIWRLENMNSLVELGRVVYRDENAIIRQKMNALGVDMAVPDLARVIEQGVEEGVFKTDNPEELARFFLQVSNVIAETQMRWLAAHHESADGMQKLVERISFYNAMLEKILGAPAGTIEPVDDRFVTAILGSILKSRQV